MTTSLIEHRISAIALLGLLMITSFLDAPASIVLVVTESVTHSFNLAHCIALMGDDGMIKKEKRQLGFDKIHLAMQGLHNSRHLTLIL